MIVAVQDKPVEIQVRTALQHLWAQVSERYSDALDPAIKYGGGPDEIRRMMLGESGTIAWIESNETEARPPKADVVEEKLSLTMRMLQLWSDLDAGRKR